MSTIFSKLWVPLAASYGVQVAAASIFVPLKTEKYYDLIGATGHLVSATASIYGPSIYRHFVSSGGRLEPFALRPQVITLALGLWAARLGMFLFHRISNAGSDSRFDKIKQDPGRFFRAWLIQATWVSLIGLPVWLTNAVPVAQTRPWGRMDTVIIAFAALSWGVEILADRQKSVWKAGQTEGRHQEKFITSGLWSISRHPNYVGEVGFHASLFALSLRSLMAPGIPGAAIGLAATSPLFTYFILRYLSGVPMLERAGNKKWGEDPAWKKYTRITPVFWPWAPIYD